MYHLLIDFDGTICDSAEGIIKSAAYAINILKPDYKLTYSEMSGIFVGPPLQIPFGKIFENDEKTILEAIRLFRVRYNEYGVYENKLYDGMIECIDNLFSNGIKSYIASSKPNVYIKSILERNGVINSFKGIYSPDLGDESLSKYDIIMLAVSDIKAKDPEAIIYMLGDRKYDIEGAHEAFLPCIGVTWGYAEDNELSEYGAEFIVNTPDELYELVLKLAKGNI